MLYTLSASYVVHAIDHLNSSVHFLLAVVASRTNNEATRIQKKPSFPVPGEAATGSWTSMNPSPAPAPVTVTPTRTAPVTGIEVVMMTSSRRRRSWRRRRRTRKEGGGGGANASERKKKRARETKIKSTDTLARVMDKVRWVMTARQPNPDYDGLLFGLVLNQLRPEVMSV